MEDIGENNTFINTTPPGYIGTKINIRIKFAGDYDQDTIDRFNEIARYLNQNVIIQLYALMNYYKLVGDNISINHNVSGWKELDLLRRLRNIFAHKTGIVNHKVKKEAKLFNEIIQHFNLKKDTIDRRHFPLPSDRVIMKLFDGCIRYIHETG
ncbi:MAG: hypothetical protein GF329_15825 [Candidatus Lokiarchaeota archaeon]|nr:hypothetical protein [Candidatus Lokiarchaeota archaeon]